jgi:hypothetical protein
VLLVVASEMLTFTGSITLPEGVYNNASLVLDFGQWVR